MTAHKHAEMIKAKADNMELVVLRKYIYGNWHEAENQDEVGIKAKHKYFLCLPKHKNAVLEGLNGREFEVRCIGDYSGANWHLDPDDWRVDKIWYMLESHESRIKPNEQQAEVKPKSRKEKRWLVVCDGQNCIDKLFCNKRQAKEFVSAFYPNNTTRDFQYVQVEIEV